METHQSSKIAKMERDWEQTKSFVIGLAGKDAEGEYRPEFAERLLKAETGGVVGEFTDREKFLHDLRPNDEHSIHETI